MEYVAGTAQWVIVKAGLVWLETMPYYTAVITLIITFFHNQMLFALFACHIDATLDGLFKWLLIAFDIFTVLRGFPCFCIFAG